MLYLENILNLFIESGSSDLHISVGKIPMIRYLGSMVHVDEIKTDFDYEIRLVEDADIEEFMQKHQKYKMKEFGRILDGEKYSLDSSLSFGDRRFRVHMYCNSSGITIVFRILQERIPTIEELFIPEEVNMFTTFQKGLVLVTGQTGSGKSTTLAAVLEKINKEQNKAIVTVEDPIEYVYTEKKCRIEQREVGLHVDSFSSATRDMMREDPDIILVGEMRDVETIKNAITLSETGHLVFATLHTKSVADSIDRIIDVFPAEQQQQIRVQLSYVLLGILNQSLVRNQSGRVPLCEMLILNDVTSSLIRQGKGNSTLRDYMRSSKNGSVHIIDNAAWHIKNNRLSLEECHDFLSASDLEVMTTILNSNGKKAEKTGKGAVMYGARRF